MKKTGFGTGLWQHSMAGKAEGGETPAQTATREAEEEVGVNREETLKSSAFQKPF